MSALLAPENLPFAVSLALLALLVLVQAIGLSDFLPDPDFGEADVDLGGGLVSLLGIGRVPLIVWLSAFLACFGLLGLSLQELFAGLFGAPFPAAAASGATLLAAVPTNSALTRALGAIWPHDETTAVPIEALIGKRGTISIGRASRGNPARAGVRDLHGQVHHVMVEPHHDSGILTEGEEVLLVRREGELFFAVDGQGPIKLTD